MIEVDLMEPFVILLDLDHTIQGNICPQLEESNLHKIINYQNPNSSKIKPDIKNVGNDFANGLLRPNFKRFIKRMKDHFPNVEFFIYTAFNNDWAKYLVKIIETTIGITFNKKVFTRNDCIFDPVTNHYYKSIKTITPYVFGTLKKEYKLVGNKHSYVFKHIVLIDNNQVLRNEETRHLIKCPCYNYKVVINIFRSIPDDVVKRNYKVISTYMLKRESASVFECYAAIHELLRKRHCAAVIDNFSMDNFWGSQLKRFKRDYQIV